MFNINFKILKGFGRRYARIEVEINGIRTLMKNLKILLGMLLIEECLRISKDRGYFKKCIY